MESLVAVGVDDIVALMGLHLKVLDMVENYDLNAHNVAVAAAGGKYVDDDFEYVDVLIADLVFQHKVNQ